MQICLTKVQAGGTMGTVFAVSIWTERTALSCIRLQPCSLRMYCYVQRFLLVWVCVFVCVFFFNWAFPATNGNRTEKINDNIITVFYRCEQNICISCLSIPATGRYFFFIKWFRFTFSIISFRGYNVRFHQIYAHLVYKTWHHCQANQLYGR